MSAPSKPKRPGSGIVAGVIRAFLAIVLIVPVSGLFIQAWRSSSSVVNITNRETDGIAFLRALQPVLTTITEDESLAVSSEAVDPAAMTANLQIASNADRLYGQELQTHTRWSDFVADVTKLRTLGKQTPIAAYNSYSAVTTALLDVYERIRDRSGLVRDQQSDVFFLEDAAVRALPTAVADAGRYGDSIIAEFGPAAGVPTALLNVATYRALLDQDSDEVGDDVSDAVDATASTSVSGSLLSTVDAFRTSIEDLEPTLLTPVTKAGPNDESAALQAKAHEETAATTLSNALFDEIETLVVARGRNAERQERISLVWLIAAILLAAVLVYLDVRRTRFNRPLRAPRPGPPPGDPGVSDDQEPAAVGAHGEGRAGSHQFRPDVTSVRLPTRERTGAPQ